MLSSTIRSRAFALSRNDTYFACSKFSTIPASRFPESGEPVLKASPSGLPSSLPAEPPTAEPLKTASAPSASAMQTPSPTPVVGLKYHVARIPLSKKLPIYHKFSHENTKKQTWIQHISGDRNKLLTELRAHLKLKEEHAKINQLTGKIILKGLWKNEVGAFLEAKGL